MTDEVALMLRVSAFGFFCALVYGLLAREPFGTLGFLGLGVGPGLASAALLFTGRGRDRDQTKWQAFLRFVGIPTHDKPVRFSFEANDLGIIPSSTIWPFSVSFGAAVLLSGLVYGAWMAVIGFAIVLWSLWGWLASTTREQRYGRLLAQMAEAVGPDREPSYEVNHPDHGGPQIHQR